VVGFERKYSLETPGKTGPEPGGDPVGIFPGSAEGLFYPQIAHGLCISHTCRVWTVSFGSARMLFLLTMPVLVASAEFKRITLDARRDPFGSAEISADFLKSAGPRCCGRPGFEEVRTGFWSRPDVGGGVPRDTSHTAPCLSLLFPVVRP